MTVSGAPDDLEPRIKKMLRAILRNRQAICEPMKGEVTLHFNGKHVSAHLTGRRVLDNDEREPPGAA